MLGRRDADHLVGVHVHALQLVESRGIFHEAQIHLPVHDLAGNLLEPRSIDADLDVREPFHVGPQGDGQQVHRRGLVGRDCQGPGRH